MPALLRPVSLPVIPAPSRVELGAGPELEDVPEAVGLSPWGDPVDERYSLTVDAGGAVTIRAAHPAGVARAEATLAQLRGPSGGLPEVRIVDGPRFAWRGLSMDLVRASFTVAEVERVIDLLALYKLNVLHLHLTDDQAWRLADGSYTPSDLRGLVTYAEERHVVLVPEVDTPGHVRSLLELRPELDSGRNRGEVELAPGYSQEAAWLDPELPATFEVIDEVLAEVAATFPSPYLHIGGDEAWGMPEDLYTDYVHHVRDTVRSLGKRPVGWQETMRAGADGDDVIQHWIADLGLGDLPGTIGEHFAKAMADVDRARELGVAVIASPLSHCYLDRPYAEPSADPAQEEQRGRLGLAFYPPKTVAESFDWDPGDVAGLEAAIWCETVSGFDDLTFLLLPRLAGIAQRAWGRQDTTWDEHQERLADHARLWDREGLAWFRSSLVDWG